MRERLKDNQELAMGHKIFSAYPVRPVAYSENPFAIYKKSYENKYQKQYVFHENVEMGKTLFSIWDHIWLEMEGLGPKWGLKPRKFLCRGKIIFSAQKWDFHIFT